MIAPHKYAYDDQEIGDGLIPPHSDLVFEILVVGVQAP